ncbi:MAG: DNA repair protein RecN [Clostridia bacterium]|nr:DNA repair protein RecN [Clostridia bacterium]
MLSKLTIKNVALIESTEIDFKSGFNVLSGETGSGKSVVLESLNFVLGAKADKTMIRNGAEECTVTAEFDIGENPAVFAVLDEFEFDREDLLIITRKFALSGKNSVKINGNSATVSMVKKLTALLIDVHGQSEHFYLLNTANQLKLIDKFAGVKDSTVFNEIKRVFDEYKDIKKELAEIGGDESSRLIRLDVLTYQINEIVSANVRAGEFEELSELKDKLLHREKIITALNAVKSSIEDEGGVSDALSNATRTLNGISGFGKDYSDIAERLDTAYAEIDDVASVISGLLDDLGYSEYSLEQVEERLGVIKNLFKKYGGDYESTAAFAENAALEKQKLENFNELSVALNDKLLKIRKKLYDLYIKLSETRKKSAVIFAKNVSDELKELGMSKAQFFVEFSPLVDFNDCKFDSANGIDDVRFMFSANSGEPTKPLSEVISGGEMSRFMLSVKAQTAKYNDIPTFIFDEIDAGISGNVAWIVAEKLVRISSSVQVIAVSHLPQIASFADNNVLIEKIERADKTETSVKTLDSVGKIAEVARLTGGDVESALSLDHAKSLISKADEFKRSLV